MGTEQACRWIVLALLASSFGVSTWHRHRADRAGGAVQRRSDGPIMVPLSLAGLAALSGLVAFVVNPAWMAWSQVPLPRAARLAGGAIGAIAVGLFWWVFRALGPNVTPTAQTRVNHALVTHGPYRFVRHPMYSFGVVMFAGYFLLTASWFILAVALAGFVLLAVRSVREETNLEARFGEAYRGYRRRTGRFLPRPARTQNGT